MGNEKRKCAYCEELSCECMLDCTRHGKGKIEYHEFNVVKGIAGWYCLECWSFKDLRKKGK